jgi:hypothetical protein
MYSTTWAWTGTVINVNRTNTDGNDGSTDWWTTSASTTDDRWRERTPFGLAEGEALPATGTSVVSGGEIYQSIDWNQTGKDARRLKSNAITLPGTPDQDYYVYVFFWSDEHDSPWRIRAGLSETECNNQLWIGYSSPSGPTTPIQVGLDSAGRILWAAELDNDAEGGSTITIYTDDEPSDNSNERTWLDAYGYGLEPVPEPVTIALLGLGGLLLHRRR